MKKNTIYKWITLLLCVILLVPQGLGYKLMPVAAAMTGKVNASSLNVRTGPDTTYSKVQINGTDVFLRRNEKVTVLQVEKDWYQVSFQFNGVTAEGYVKSEFITTDEESSLENPDTTVETPTVTPTPTPTITPKVTEEVTATVTPTPKPQKTETKATLNVSGVVTATTLNVRKKPNQTSAKVGSIIKKKKVTILNETMVKSQKWYHISYKTTTGTVTGYVLGAYIKLSITKNVHANINTKKAVKIRKGAGTKYSYLTTKKGSQIALPNKKFVAITKEVTDAKGIKWFQITFNLANVKYSGFILADQVLLKANTAEVTPTPKPEDTVTVTPTLTPTPMLPPTLTPTPTPIANIQEIYTRTNGMLYYTSKANVVKDVFTSQDLLYDSTNNMIELKQSEKVTICTTVRVGSIPWYYVEFTKAGILYYGYVKAEYIMVGEGGVVDQTTPGAPAKVLTDAEFEAKMTSEGFPESYKPYLRQLHQQYPTWVFETYQTGLDWNTVIQKENVLGVNLISNGKSLEWKSFDAGAYNWEKDSFVAFDGSTWVMASKEAVAYYMDPRNFLTDKGIFQFEMLNYKSEYQNVTGVEGILYNTPMYNTSYSYVDSYGQNLTYTYSQTFMKAAEYSGVSPYHLASRVKQEVVTGTTTMSSSVSGTVTGLEGLYNFFNIGAYHSTAAGGAVANGLKFAKNGTTDASLNALYLIPWNSPYNSIVGGAYHLGRNYINRGQNTIYLQKFNVTPTSTYQHQYMANIQAPEAEAKKTFAAYSGMMNLPIVFSIPIYLNMPEMASPLPSPVKNPNNWLKTLEVSGHSLTPTFKINADQTYSLIVGNSVSTIEVMATPVSSKATVMGTGFINLQVGNNIVTVSVIAENGNKRDYIINVVRE